MSMNLKVAIVHYWLVTMRGGEKVVAELCRIYPQADLFTHVLVPSAIDPEIRTHRITTSMINRLPFARCRHQMYLPLMPVALESFDLSGYDLVISSESGPAKGVLAPPDALHVCYVHSPMRYLWNMVHAYRRTLPAPARPMWDGVAHLMRQWDVSTASRVDRFVANSATVAARVRRYWGREADVIYPPVDVGSFKHQQQHDGFYLLAGQLTGYKRPDLAVEACRASRRRLVVIGGGEELATIRKMAGEGIEVLGPQPFSVLRDHLQRCRALLFPGEEDFGIVPVEAMACGKPVIAYGRGGARETVVDGVTGLFFYDQTVTALTEALDRFERADLCFKSDVIGRHAARFDAAVFRDRFARFVSRTFAERDGAPQARAFM